MKSGRLWSKSGSTVGQSFVCEIVALIGVSNLMDC